MAWRLKVECAVELLFEPLVDCLFGGWLGGRRVGWIVDCWFVSWPVGRTLGRLDGKLDRQIFVWRGGISSHSVFVDF